MTVKFHYYCRSATVMYVCEIMQQLHFSAPEMIFYFKFQTTSGLEYSQKLDY